jgi:hypothetical protein
MPTEIEKLPLEDQDIVLRAPAIVAILAAISDDGVVSQHEKAEAIRLTHFRTYTSQPILHNFYKKVDPLFEQFFEDEMKQLPEDWEEKKEYLEEKLIALREVLPKMDKVYAKELVLSLKSLARHVFKSNSSFLESFVLPIFINKLERESFDPKIG